MIEKQDSDTIFLLAEKQGKEIITDRKFQFKRLWLFMLNSIIIYIFSYFIIFYLAQAICYFIAADQHIKGIFYYFEIVYPNDTKWDLYKTITVSTVGPFIVFIMGWIFLDNAPRLKRISPYFKMFFAWLAYHGVNNFLGSVIAGSFTGIGVGYTLDLFFYPNMFVYVFFVLGSIGILALIGHITCEFFLSTSPSLYWLKSHNHPYYLTLTILIPYLVGTIIIYLIKYPDHLPQRFDNNSQDIILNLSMFFLIFPMLFKRFAFDLTPKIASKERSRTIHFRFLIISVVLIAFFRIYFS